ncbi:MAG: hypothetical protein Q9209_002426 [Squamulea sp. 1 TL-2023]
MILRRGFFILLWFSRCSALTLDAVDKAKITANSSSDYDFDTSQVHVASLPTKPLTWWVGRQGFSTLLQPTFQVGQQARCNEREFGRPMFSSCGDAWKDIPDTIEVERFGSRSAGLQWDVILPFKFISRDGLCTIDVSLSESDQAYYDEAKSYDLKKAAADVISQCVSKSTGGTVNGLGQYRRIRVSVSQYRPNVRCMKENAPLDLGMCQIALNIMPVVSSPMVFGDTSTPRVKMLLPQRFVDPGLKCLITIDMIGPAQYVCYWWEIWHCDVNGSPVQYALYRACTAWSCSIALVLKHIYCLEGLFIEYHGIGNLFYARSVAELALLGVYIGYKYSHAFIKINILIWVDKTPAVSAEKMIYVTEP